MESEQLSVGERLYRFFSEYRDARGRPKYRDMILELLAKEDRYLPIDFQDLIEYDAELARELSENPMAVLEEAREAVVRLLRMERPTAEVDPESIYVGVVGEAGHPIRIREVNSRLLGKLVSLTGLLTRLSQVYSLVEKAVYVCPKCGYENPPVKLDPLTLTAEAPRRCPRCRESKLSFSPEASRYVDVQFARLQERPDELPPGQIPRFIDVVLRRPLVEAARPGDIVRVVGVLYLKSDRASSKRKVFEFVVHAVGLETLTKEATEVKLTRDDIEMLRREAEGPDFYQRVVRSLAPSIYGLDFEKEAILLALIGGKEKVLPDGIRQRGNIHVLLIGDPGTAKSELLKYAAMLAPKGLYTSGRGTTAAGLCVSGDTVVYTSRGPTRIADVVEAELARGEEELPDGVWVSTNPNPVGVCTFDGSGASMGLATAFYRLRAEETVTVRTSRGDITVTPETRLLCSVDGRLEWRRASELRPGDLLVRVAHLPDVGNSPPPTIDYLGDDILCECDEEFLRRLVEGLRERFGSLRAAARTLGINEDKLYRVWRRGRPTLGELRRVCSALGIGARELVEGIRAFCARARRGLERVRMPEVVCEELMEFLGMLYACGEVSVDDRSGRRYIRCSGGRQVIERLASLSKRLFDVDVVVEGGRGGRVTARIPSRVLTDLAARLGVARRGLRGRLAIPPEVAGMPNSLVAAFLRGLLACCQRADGRIRLHAPSRVFAEQVRMLLLRFGVDCAVERESDGRPVLVVEERSLDALEARGHGVAAPAFTLARVEGVERRRGEFTVYDLTVEGSHCFVANGFVVHNTAAVIREPGGEMSLEAGAVVLADMGVCCIDEIDKMRPEDRVALHEALEQQTVSIAKGGIVATLNARTTVIAAANPKEGRYNPNKPPKDNINLPITLLSRFDLIYVIRDVPEEERDQRLVDHVLRTRSSAGSEYGDVYSLDFLRKYIAYAKRLDVRMTEGAMNKIREYYLKMRARSSEDDPISISPRQLESLIRLSEAVARAKLKTVVEEEDAERAIMLVDHFLKSVGMDVETGKPDIDIIYSGVPQRKRSKTGIVVDAVERMTRRYPDGEYAYVRDVIDYIVNHSTLTAEEAEEIIDKLIAEGVLYKPGPDRVAKVSR